MRHFNFAFLATLGGMNIGAIVRDIQWAHRLGMDAVDGWMVARIMMTVVVLAIVAMLAWARAEDDKHPPRFQIRFRTPSGQSAIVNLSAPGKRP